MPPTRSKSSLSILKNESEIHLRRSVILLIKRVYFLIINVNKGGRQKVMVTASIAYNSLRKQSLEQLISLSCDSLKNSRMVDLKYLKQLVED